MIKNEHRSHNRLRHPQPKFLFQSSQWIASKAQFFRTRTSNKTEQDCYRPTNASLGCPHPTFSEDRVSDCKVQRNKRQANKTSKGKLERTATMKSSTDIRQTYFFAPHQQPGEHQRTEGCQRPKHKQLAAGQNLLPVLG